MSLVSILNKIPKTHTQHTNTRSKKEKSTQADRAEGRRHIGDII